MHFFNVDQLMTIKQEQNKIAFERWIVNNKYKYLHWLV